MKRWVDALKLREGMKYKGRTITNTVMQEDGTLAVVFDDGEKIDVLKVEDSLLVEVPDASR